jgi:hypothetical protein
MVAHLWANQSQDHARNSSDSVYFDGDTIYSYGRHFPMARHIDGVVLITTDSYSSTTGGHLSMTRSACCHLTCFHVPNVLACDKFAHNKNFKDYQQRYTEALLLAGRARSNAKWRLREVVSLISEANRYAQHFDLDTCIKEIDTTELLAQAKVKTKAATAETRKRIKARAERYQAESDAYPAMLERWRDGSELPRLSWQNPDRDKLLDNNALLRVTGDNIQTSQGAAFPTSYVANAWRVINICKQRSTTFHANGETVKLGHFQLHSVDASGNVRAGCHHVTFAECKLLAQTLGLTT